MADSATLKDVGGSDRGDSSLSGSDSSTARNSNQIVSRKAKRRMLSVLNAIVIVGVVLIVILTIVLLAQQSKNSKQYHNDTLNAVQAIKDEDGLNSKIIICMLKVLPEQRTDNLASQCRKQAQATTPSGPGQTTTTTTTKTNISTTTSPSSSSTPANVTSPEPNSNPVTTPTPTTPVVTPATSQPDNNGIILQLPLLGKIHIPSLL